MWYRKYLKDKCEVCGSTFILQAHHFYYRSSYAHCRFLKDNHITLCRRCHFLLHHQDPKKIEEQIIQKRGQKWLKTLQKMAYKRPKPSFETIGYYQNRIEAINLIKTFIYSY